MSRRNRLAKHTTSSSRHSYGKRSTWYGKMAAANVDTECKKKMSWVGLLCIVMTCAMVFVLTLLFVMGHAGKTADAAGKDNKVVKPAAYGALNQPKGSCGNTEQPACPSVDRGWFPVSSETPAAVDSAIVRSSEFLTMQRRFGYDQLDTPVLVYAFHAHTGIEYYDSNHWLVSVKEADGLRDGLFDFVYDPAGHRMRFSSFGAVPPEDPHSKLAFPYIPLSVALTQLRNQHITANLSLAAPTLIFFPIDPRSRDLTSTRYRWTGGGDSPMHPLWRIQGVDGRDYFVGADLHVYTVNKLPFAPGLP